MPLIACGLVMDSDAIEDRRAGRPAVCLTSAAIACFSAGTALLVVAVECTAFSKAAWACSVLASCACSAARFDGTGAAR